MGWPASGLLAGSPSCPGPHPPPLHRDPLPQHEAPGLLATSSRLKPVPALASPLLAVCCGPPGARPPSLSWPLPVPTGSATHCPPCAHPVCSAALSVIHLQRAAPQQPLWKEVGCLLAPPHSSAPALPPPQATPLHLGLAWDHCGYLGSTWQEKNGLTPDLHPRTWKP